MSFLDSQYKKQEEMVRVNIEALMKLCYYVGNKMKDNREGKILNVDFSEYFGKPGFKMLLSLDESHLNPTIEIDVYEIQEDLIEFTHTPKDGGEIIEVTVV